MIYHLKALIQGFQNLKRNWVWHHPGGATAQLTKKAPPSLKLVCSLSEPRYSNFHSKFQYLLLRAFQKGIISFPGSTGCKMAGCQSLDCETNFHFLAIYIVKQTFFGCAFHTSNFDDLPFCSQLTQEKIIYLFESPEQQLLEFRMKIGVSRF